MPGVACKGTKLQHGAPPEVDVVELLSCNLPEQGKVTAEDTNLDDDSERHSSTGVTSAGEVTGNIQFSPAQHAALIALQDTNDKTPWTLLYPSGAKHTWSGANFRMGVAVELKGFFQAPFSIQVDGKIGFSPAA